MVSLDKPLNKAYNTFLLQILQQSDVFRVTNHFADPFSLFAIDGCDLVLSFQPRRLRTLRHLLRRRFEIRLLHNVRVLQFRQRFNLTEINSLGCKPFSVLLSGHNGCDSIRSIPDCSQSFTAFHIFVFELSLLFLLRLYYRTWLSQVAYL